MASYDAVLDSFRKLHECGAGDGGLELLSSKGKIVAAMLRHDRLSVKDIPHLAGVSFRTCFEQLRLLELQGVVEKSNDPLDGRRAIVKLNIKKLSETIESGTQK
jgi:DNA-binding MarR family transcriptional regulator